MGSIWRRFEFIEQLDLIQAKCLRVLRSVEKFITTEMICLNGYCNKKIDVLSATASYPRVIKG